MALVHLLIIMPAVLLLQAIRQLAGGGLSFCGLIRLFGTPFIKQYPGNLFVFHPAA